MKDIYILAIETSCDETSVAIVKNGHECMALTILSQMDIHASFGGVVPEIASRLHTENITMVLDETLKKANMDFNDIDAFAVTNAPGLLGSLLVGLECAKTLSFIYNKPLITVNHLAGHIYANNLANNLNFPLLALIVSGGHTELIIMEGDYKFKKLGETLDDAIGESYDKVARVLDMPYPGGPNVEKLALKGKPSYELNLPMKNDSYNFSFSGLKSNVINLVHNEIQRGNKIKKEDLACSFQTIAIKEITNKVDLALKNYSEIKNMLIAGGVSANKYLRSEIEKVTNKYNVNLSMPKFIYCTDNAAMIGAAAYPLYLNKKFSSLDISVKSHESLV
ncbi:MAG TPA: tRNA (adenosine(37)-N6)-threonylcarbamoyltransferase complex transferase subunit TsaD [Bacilli bacterium]|nr:tRNA (adenosine(37)-N6)-threonylcarbamoyltransferase complex transferase subunit TsaD [Bacilli bacterium]